MADLSSPSGSPRRDGTVVVLSVSRLAETHARLRGIFEHSNWQLVESCDHRQAFDLLRREPVGVVVYDDESRPGSSWREFLDEMGALPQKPLLIVASRTAGEREWAEVLNLGGYDMLAEPFDAVEVSRVISIAWLHWRNQRKPVHRAAGAGQSRYSAQA